MSDSVIIGLCSGIPATIAAVASLIVALRTGRKVNGMHDKLMAKEYKRGQDSR